MGAFLMKAFPTKNENLPNESQGMDLRDYFAAKAMQTMLTWDDFGSLNVSKEAYMMADAMMEARNDQE
jgi:hypothetical protein